MVKRTTGARLGLGEPWAGKLADFCEALYGPPEINIVRRALDTFIDKHLERETDLRKRYDAARKKRLEAEKGNNLKLVSPKKDG